jgi:shikimate dehydrogenase
VSRRPVWLPDGRTRILGIVGRPLEHSLSPALHTAVLRALDRNLIYLPLPVSEDRLAALVCEASGLGILGFNVTTPYKETVARLVRPLDEETVGAGMVNTVVIGDGAPAGCGTDGAGILAYLEAAGLGGTPYGILGFGPTARSLVHHGRRRGHSPVLIVTRRPGAVRSVLATGGAARVEGKAEIAVAGWDDLGVEAKLPGERATAPARPGVWVSTLPPGPLSLPDSFWAFGGTDAVMLDMNYGVGRTARMEEARLHGWRSADGLGPLCRQAALSLSLWLGEDVPAELYFRALGRTERSLRPGR